MLRIFLGLMMCFAVLSVPQHPAFAATEALRLNLTVETRTEVKGKQTEVDTRNVQVVLQQGGFIKRVGNTDTVYDFQKRRILKIDHEKKIVLDESLYGEVAFRTSELKHRLGMEALVRKTKGAGHDYRFIYPGELEHAYGLLAKGKSGVSLTVRKSGAALKYDGDELGSFETGNWQIDDALKETYRHFLIYGYAMHPRLRNEMSDAVRGFGKLSLRHSPMDKTRKFTHITVDEVMPVQPGPLSAPVGYKVIYVDAEKLQPAMAAVHQDKDRRSAQDYIAHIDKALSRGKYTEALLASWEHMVQFGSFPEGTVNRIVSAAPEKDWSRSLVKLIANPPEPNDLEEYTKSFQTVADYVSAPNKYELNVHLADLYLQLGDAQKAYDMLAYALAQNPYLTGAWVTLGDVFYRQFDMEAAFACWDAALAVEPSHALVGKSAKLREELVSLYPEFF